MDQYTHHIPPPCEEAVDVVYADAEVLVVNKPTGLLSVPGRIVKDCVLNRMLFDYPNALIVHRLDLDTSGLMVFALSKAANSDLSRQFRERTVQKTYIADVYGVSGAEGTIDLPIAADWANRPRNVIREDGKAAITQYQRLSSSRVASRLELKPETGRSHQLRIHLAAIEHPILGCDLYAHDEALAMSDRLHLHASQLAFDHPTSGKRLDFTSVVPFDCP